MAIPGPRFPAIDPYLEEWNRLMDAGIPNQYRTYGPQRLIRDPEVGRVWRQLEPDLHPDDTAYHLYRPMIPMDGARGDQLFPGVPLRDHPSYFVNWMTKRANLAGDIERRLQLYGPDPGKRPRTILYSIPEREAASLGAEDIFRSLGYPVVD